MILIVFGAFRYIFFFQMPYLPELALQAQDIARFDVLKQIKYMTSDDIEAYKYTYQAQGEVVIIIMRVMIREQAFSLNIILFGKLYSKVPPVLSVNRSNDRSLEFLPSCHAVQTCYVVSVSKDNGKFLAVA